MKKILTIAATALLTTIAGTAHAQTTGTASFPGAVASSCNMTVAGGGLVQSGNSLITNATSGFATAKVICNGNNTLGIAVNTSAATSKLYNGTAVANFGGGDGAYATATTGTSFTTTAPTTAAGDTAKIGVVVSPTTAGQLLQGKPDYNAVVDVTLTAL